MNKIFGFAALLLSIMSNTVWAASSVESSVPESTLSSEYLSISVDRVVVDTAGLAAASATLAGSVDGLALAIGQLSADSAGLNDEQKQILLDAITSAHQASDALTTLAQQLPQSAQGISERLPQMINAARDSVVMITESLPLATEKAIELMDSVLDAALQKLIVYTIALIAIIALALIAIMWFIYRQYLGPLMRKLDELVGAPEHFERMALHMKGTSDNLLALETIDRRTGCRGVEKFRRRGVRN